MKYLRIPFLLLLVSAVWIGKADSDTPAPIPSNHQKYISKDLEETAWVDSTLNLMSDDQKIGQLFMIPVDGKENAEQDKTVRNLIEKYSVGGLIFMKGEPVIQVSQVNRYQQVSRIPLMVAQDAEWGVNMRLENTLKFPKNMTLGAIQNDSLLYQMGAIMAQHCRRVGVEVNFAPVVDINNNAANPVINDRSFGENKYNVARKGMMISKGMSDNQVIPCAKHFPGHGDTGTDSHLDLPMIPHSRARMDTMELYPFMRLRDAGIPAMMVAHLSVPSLDATSNLPSTLSSKIVQGVLRDEMHYEGLIFTDAMNMKGVLKYYPTGDAELRAFKAGVDILLMSTDAPKAISTIKNALATGDITKTQLEEKVRRILQSKYRLGLTKVPYSSPYNLFDDLNGESAKFLKKKLYEAAVTLAKNDNNFVPLRNLESLNIAYLQVGGTSANVFGRTLQKYANVRTFYLKSDFSAAEMSATLVSLKSYNTIIIGNFGMNKKPSDNFGINLNTASLSRTLTQQGKNTILAIFGSPYALKNFGSETSVLVGYEDEPDAQQAVASAIFGGLIVDGKLPVTASPQFKEGQGFVIPEIIRFGLSLPEEQGMRSASLNKIDSIVNSYIRMRAIPGAAVAVMKGKHIVYEKGFGKMDYGVASDSIDPLNAMYDIASMTKITATIASSMRLYEQGILNLDGTVGQYIPEFQGTNKSSITVRELMQHTAGLKAWIPFYKETFADKGQTQLRKDIYSNTYSTDYNIEVAPQLYMNQNYVETMWNEIKYSEMGTRGKMVYSDLSMIILARIIQNLTGSSVEDYACDNFYTSMGMNSTMFNPGKKGYAYRCVPTELDDNWRHCVVQGYVHDYAAAMFGGVSGHAGLFSNVYDLCKMYGMVKNGGTYGGRYYFSPETVGYFTRKQIAGSRRGLGWDKPNSDPDKPDPASPKASDDTYGHTGFTGTCVWVDPKYDIVFIFLANRTYPDQNNKMFNKRAVRKIVMDKVYESMGIK